MHIPNHFILLMGPHILLAHKHSVFLLQDLGLNSSVIKKVGDPISSTVGVWNGETLLHSEGILLEHALSDLSILLDEGNFLLDLKENYRARDGEKDGGSFTSIEAFLKPGRLDRYTSISSDAYFTRQKVSNETLRDLLEPLQRCIYGQGLSAHAFSTLVSLTSMVGAGSVSTGNSQLVKAMFSASNANVNLETRVTRVTRRPSTTENADDELEFVLETNTSETHRCRSVVVAAPIEFTGIEWRGGIDIDPSTFRKFEDCYVTIVRAQHVNATFFGLAKASANVPFNIFTTQDAFDTMHVPFTVLQFEERLDNGYNLYKFFSVERIATSTIDDIFVSPTVVFEQHWNYTFPVLKVTDDANGGDFQSIVLSPGVFYLNTMESVASAMEGSVIAGRNVAELASKVLL